jgi:hypothetical protein
MRCVLNYDSRFYEEMGFGVSYCGACSADAALHVDHVRAVANGGASEPANLVTACRVCNQGKAASLISATLRSLGAKELSIIAHASMTREQRKQRASKAGKASSSNLTPEQRSNRARKAVQAREAKRKAKFKPT